MRRAARQFRLVLPVPTHPSSSPRDLDKKYKDFLAVDGLSFEVAPGESFGLLGPNGAGKSTTMRMIGAVSTRTSGDLSILGLDPDQYGPEIRSHLGRRAAAGQPRRRAARAREPASSTAATSACRGKVCAQQADELLAFAQLEDKAQEQGRPPLRRHEAPAHDRARAHQRPAHPAARRADHRASTRRRATSCGTGCSGSRSGHDARAHDPLHGRGRAALRPARRRRQGPHHGRGHARRAHPRALEPRGARGALRLRPQRGGRAAAGRASATASRCCPTAS